MGAWDSALCFSLIVIVAACVGCSKEAAFSTDDLETEGRFKSDRLYATRSDWANRGHSAGNIWQSKRLVVCRWRGYQARSFLKFASLPDSTAQIDSVHLFLYATRVEGDVASNALSIHALTDTLYQTEIFWDNMPAYSQDLAVAFSPPAESEDSVRVDLTEIVSSWTEGETTNFGLVIKLADDLPGSDVIVEFASREVPTKEITSAEDTTVLDLRPTLRIAYTDTAGETQFTKSVASADVFADTLVTPFAPDTLSLIVGNGTPSRGFVKFDVTDSIPIEATVTRAVLKLTPNLEESSFDSMRVTCHAILDPDWTGFDTRIGISGAGMDTLRSDVIMPGETIRLVVTPLIQPLVSRRQNNYGLLIKSADESFDLDFVKFFSSRWAGTDSLPMLQVDYLLPPSPWYREDE